MLAYEINVKWAEEGDLVDVLTVLSTATEEYVLGRAREYVRELEAQAGWPEGTWVVGAFSTREAEGTFLL